MDGGSQVLVFRGRTNHTLRKLANELQIMEGVKMARVKVQRWLDGA